MVYLDTSALVKLYAMESFSEQVAAFVAHEPALTVSRLVELELRCVLARKVRDQVLSPQQADAVWCAFNDDILGGLFDSVPVEDAHVARAMALLQEASSGMALRALDALHLGVALAHAINTIATSDVGLATAARQLGFSVSLFAPLTVHEASPAYR